MSVHMYFQVLPFHICLIFMLAFLLLFLPLHVCGISILDHMCFRDCPMSNVCIPEHDLQLFIVFCFVLVNSLGDVMI